MGYSRAGFEVVGVDIKPQPHYPFEFHQADALTYPLDGFDAIHASPPCQGYSSANRKHYKPHPLLIEATRELLTGRRYVLENVEGARRHLIDPVRVCGGALGLGTWRHRLFEGVRLAGTAHDHSRPNLPVYGWLDGRRLWTRKDGTELRAARTLAEAQVAMGIDWMTWDELREAIPPAYTEWVGRQLMVALGYAPRTRKTVDAVQGVGL